MGEHHDRTGCFDCGREYGDEYGFPDLVISNEAWNKISPTNDEGGLLCPSCICKRLAEKGLRNIPGAFMSGPIKSMSEEDMGTIMELDTIRKQFKLLFKKNDLNGALMFSVDHDE